MIAFLYNTVVGRWILDYFMKHHWDRVIVRFLCSPLSKPYMRWYVWRHHVRISQRQLNSFRSFREFFARSKKYFSVDMEPDHLISPCDGWLSVFPIEHDSTFEIKHSRYRIGDFLQDDSLEKRYEDGLCMIFRLTPCDYHRYCYIDDGYQGTLHPIPGVLHSVQPIACEHEPVYILNKRCWCLLTTEHFGPVVQTEIGALIVGGIENHHEHTRIRRGMEKGRFELAGSTIVLLFEKDRVSLLPRFLEQCKDHGEVRVRHGLWIGNAIKQG